MFYRVDYVVAVMLAGFLAGVLISNATQKITSSQLARIYYAAVAVLVVLRTGAFACEMLASQVGVSKTVEHLAADSLSFFFGALFGMAVRRNDSGKLLLDSQILWALRMTLAFTFAMAGIGKAFAMAPMTDFFTQSGYSVTFLKFIIIAEIFGAVGLLVPWATLPALIGLSIDMFGAVVTHIHNGDPLNDSTGAIASLIRFAALGILWAMCSEAKFVLSLKKAAIVTTTIAAACLLIAIGGSAAIRMH